MAIVVTVLLGKKADQLGLGPSLKPPSFSHPFGTDQYGRDEFSRVCQGILLSFEIGTLVTGVALVVGTPLGLLIGYLGGWLDAVVGRLLEVLFAFPSLLLGLVLVTILGSGLRTVEIALLIIYTPIVARFVRGAVVAERNRDYIRAARANGAGLLRIARKHLLRNIASEILVLASSVFAFSILAEAALSYLGVGAQPPTATLGRLLTDNQGFLTSDPYLVVFPAAALTLLVLGLSLIGDGLRDQLDPQVARRLGQLVVRQASLRSDHAAGVDAP